MVADNTFDSSSTTTYIISIPIVAMIGILIAVCVWRRNHSRESRGLRHLSAPEREGTLEVGDELRQGSKMPLREDSRTIRIGRSPRSTPKREDSRTFGIGRSTRSDPEREVFDFGNEIRITLLGKSGNGKSATGNLILGEELFETKISASSVTVGCKRERKKRFGVNIDVVDTPGLCDTKTPNEIVFKEILKCVAITSPGPHAFLLVLSVTSRFTPEEEATVNNFIERFGEHIFQYLIVIITRKDELEREKMSEDIYLVDMPLSLKTFLHKCGSRCMFLNNRDSEENKEKQCFELLTMINDNVKGKSCPYYTDEAYQKAERLFKEGEEEKMNKINEELQKQIDEKVASMKASNEEKERKLTELLEEKEKKLDEIRAEIREKHKNDVENEEGTFKSFIGNLKKMGHGAVDAVFDLAGMMIPDALRYNF